MIIAILPDASTTEILLNNLSEADFNLNDVSVIMQDQALRNKITQDVGPLKGTGPDQLGASLKKAGASSAASKKASDAVAHGKVLVAMTVDPKYEQAAHQMFQDMSAQFLED